MTVRQGYTVENDPDLGGALAFAAERGFEFVELNMEHAFERRRIDPDAVADTLAEHGVDVTVHLPYRLDPGSPHEHVRDGACRELGAALDAAATLGAERAVMHASSGAHADRWDADEIRAVIFDSIRRVDAAARDRGVELVVENLKSPFFDAADFPRLFERTDASACLDTGHAHVSGVDGTEQAALLREHGDRIAHVHLNETRNDREDEHLPVGLGVVEFGPLARAMVETDWKGTCTHEVYGFDRAYAAHGKAAFDRLLADARGTDR
jgi:sugar phosphate isomerase/epimerase